MYDKEKCIAMINNLTKSQLVDMMVHLQAENGVIDEILEDSYGKSLTEQSPSDSK